MRNEIKYCVNYKGQKIKPYTSVAHPYKKKIDWDSIVSYAIVFCIGILAITSTTIMLMGLLK
jgi:hypothetical protein